jgi:CRP-like cAMP-binding protein
VRQYPDVALLLAKLLNYRLKKAYSIISNATLQSLDTRLRRTLAMLASDVGSNGEQVDIKITQQALGHFVQCTRPTINKALKDLERTGAIKVGYGQIRILDVKALRSEIEGEVLYVL